jgi:hypothetical protein
MIDPLRRSPIFRLSRYEEAEMHILKMLLIAVASLFTVVLASSAAEALLLEHRHLLLSRIIFITVGVLFIAGCIWRLSHADRNQSGNEH